MVEVKFVIELIIIVAALALVTYIFWKNYSNVADQFFKWLGSLASITGAG